MHKIIQIDPNPHLKYIRSRHFRGVAVPDEILKVEAETMFGDWAQAFFYMLVLTVISKWESRIALSLISLCLVDWVIPYDT